MIFSSYDNASCGDESTGFLVFAISLFPIILPSATIQPFNVGYSKTALVDGNKLVAAQFAPVGNAEGYDIQNIVAEGADVESFVALQTLTSSGKANETFSWDTWMYVTDKPAWIDDAGIATRKFAPGEALWVQGRAGYSITTAGQVDLSDLVVELVDGNKAVGNPFPVKVNIQDIVAEGADVESFVALQTLTSSGKANETFSWDTWMYVVDEPAWIDDVGIATREFEPGEGIWVQGRAGYTLRIPAPEL